MILKPTNDPWVYIDENGNEVISTPPSITEFDINLLIISFIFCMISCPLGWYISQWYLATFN